MADTGFVIAGAGASNASFGDVSWDGPGNIAQDGDQTFSEDITEYLVSSAHGFAIPTGATIDGIEVRVRSLGEFASPAVAFERVRIVKGGVIGSTDKAAGTLTTSAVNYDFGGASDLWGEMWAATDINASNFGVAVAFDASSNFAYVNDVWIKVYYTEGASNPTATGTLKAGASAISGAAIRAALAAGTPKAQAANTNGAAVRTAFAEGTPKAQAAVIDGTATGAPQEATGVLESGLAALGGVTPGDITFIGSASASEGDGSDPVIDLSGLGLQEGDYVIVEGYALDGDFNAVTGIQTAGFVEILDIWDNGSVVIFSKFMGEIPDSSIICNGSGTSDHGTSYVAQVWRNADQITPEDVAPTSVTSSIDPPSINPNSDDCGISVFAAAAADITFTGAPSGYSDFETATGSGAFFTVSTAAAQKILTGSAAEDPGVFSISGADFEVSAATIALRPATISGPATATRTVKAEGALTSQEASLIGQATIFVQGIATGALKAGASVVDGAASRTAKAAGALQSGSASVVGAAKRAASAIGVLVSGPARIVGRVIRKWFTVPSPGETWTDLPSGTVETWYDDTPGPGETWRNE